MALALTIFLLVLLTEFISWVGKTSLMELVYELYLRVFYSKKIREQKELKATLLATKSELMQTSSQDQFAKWAKLKRKIDKGFTDLETLNKELASIRSAFSVKFHSFLWIVTTGAQFVIGWWYRKAAVFYLPPGWLGPLAWWMAFPFAPTGSVSCGVWQFACRRVIRVGERVTKELLSTDPASADAQEDVKVKAE